MKTLLLLITVSIPIEALAVENWVTLFEASSPDLIVRLENTKPTAYQDPAAQLYMRVLRKNGMTTMATLDISYGRYSKRIYGDPDVDFAYDGKGDRIILLQCRYGDDGWHSPNILRIYAVRAQEVLLTQEQNMHGVSIIQKDSIVSRITGEYVATLCSVCDGWEVSAPDDMFLIPMVLDFRGSQIVRKVDLPAEQRAELMSRLDRRIALNNKEQLGYGRLRYPKYAEGVRAEIIDLLYGP